MISLTAAEANALLNAVSIALTLAGEPPAAVRTDMIAAVRKVGRSCGTDLGRFPLKTLAAECREAMEDSE